MADMSMSPIHHKEDKWVSITSRKARRVLAALLLRCTLVYAGIYIYMYRTGATAKNKITTAVRRPLHASMLGVGRQSKPKKVKKRPQRRLPASPRPLP